MPHNEQKFHAIFPSHPAQAARDNLFRVRGELGIYKDDADLLKQTEQAVEIRRLLEESGSIRYQPFNFAEITQFLGAEIAGETNYSSVAPERREEVRKLHESLENHRLQEILSQYGIMTIATGAKVPEPQSDQPQRHLLSLTAHPDDAEIMHAYRTMHEVFEQGNIMQYLCLFPGTGGGQDRGYSAIEGQYIRTFTELVPAARILGVPFVHFVMTPGQDVLGNQNFGIGEWTHIMDFARAPEVLGLAIARSVPADHIIGHTRNRASDWHTDHSEFAGIVSEWAGKFGQWTAYAEAIPDTRIRHPQNFRWSEQVIWADMQNLPGNDVTVYYQHPEGDESRGNTGHFNLAKLSLAQHRSQSGKNYFDGASGRNRFAGAFGDVNNPKKPSHERLHTPSHPGMREITQRVEQTAKQRYAWYSAFENPIDLLTTPEPNFS